MSPAEAQRRARIVLVGPDGGLRGELPPLAVEVPFWAEVESLVRAVRAHHGVDITIVRLLDVEGGGVMRGGLATYLAEASGAVDCAPCSRRLDEHPLRAPYARPGGARADLRWARSVLAAQGLEPVGPAVQVKTWNLSSLWRIPLGTRTAWLKSVPAFFAHEGPLLAAMATLPGVPRLFGQEPGRALLREIPGRDLFAASLEQRLAMVELLVELQRTWIGRVDELFELGLPDWRAARLAQAFGAVLELRRGELSASEAAVLDRFAADLPARAERIAACGIPETLVHGDFHSGNVRGSALDMVLLDWSDSAVGHPLLDHSAFFERLELDEQVILRRRWIELWERVLPGSRAGRAMTLLEPVAAARRAALYQHFLDHIEPSERCYHEGDPLHWLKRTAQLARASARH